MGFLVPSLIVNCGNKDDPGFEGCVEDRMPYLLGLSIVISTISLLAVIIYLPNKPKYTPTTTMDVVEKIES